MRLDFK